MTIQNGCYGLFHLAFLDELKNVQVMGAVNHIGANMRKLTGDRSQGQVGSGGFIGEGGHRPLHTLLWRHYAGEF